MNHRIQHFPLQPTTIHPYTKPTKIKHEKSHFKSQFEEAKNSLSQLKISKHANHRMIERNIHISSFEWEQIANKVAEARNKGVNDSLVLLKNAAMIISAKNSTVVTVLDRNEAQQQIFTNIDGTIVME